MEMPKNCMLQPLCMSLSDLMLWCGCQGRKACPASGSSIFMLLPDACGGPFTHHR